MASSTIAVEPSPVYKPVASALHILLVLAVIASLSYIGARTSESLRMAPEPNRVALYVRTIASQWVLLAIVIIGVRRHGSSLSRILGSSWTSLRELFRDLGLAAGFWILAVPAISMLRPILRSLGPARSVLYLLPQTGLERFLWILVCVTAGICEEATFRGYLQTQFTAFSRNVVVGILLAAVVFGLAHSYQGPQGAISNGVLGALLGSLAAWRRSLRPGILAHTWSDLFAGIIAPLLKIKVA